MRAITLYAASLALLLGSTTAAFASPGDHPELIASDDILIGIESFSVAGSGSFSFEATDLAGKTMTTDTEAFSGPDYDLRLVFYDRVDVAGMVLIQETGRCDTPSPDETCVVPAGTDKVTVQALSGLDLHVDVYVV